MKTLVVIPTYNEADNIEPLIEAIFQNTAEVSILVVDDGSPDGTGEIVKKIMKGDDRVNLLSRTAKNGLGKAYIAGFDWGMENGFTHIVEMDADFSHRPQDLVSLVENLQHSDFIVGSRYIPGGKTVNWSIWRKLISRGGGLYARMILGFPLNDWTGGFNGWSVETLKGIDTKSVESEGYSFQIELKYRALKNGFKGKEVPIVFDERREGKSKMSMRIVIEAFFRVWSFRFKV